MPEVQRPTWTTKRALSGMRDLQKRGEEFVARGGPEDGRAAWHTAVDSTMASAFGRGTDEFHRVISATVELVFDGRDRFPELLRDQVRMIAEYVRILEARFKDEVEIVPPAPSPPAAVDKVLHVLSRFSRVAKHLKTRRTGRPALLVEDEYDVQYLLQILLDVHFNDVRPEDHGPSHAGGNTRIDFILEEEKIAVEAKMTREGLKDKDVGEQLVVDIARYSKHPSCKTLVCFVYDPEHLLKNPDGIERDLTKNHDGLDVHVMIRPKA